MSLKGRGGREVILLKYCSEDILLSSVKKIHFFIIIAKNIFPVYQPTLQTIVFQKQVFLSLKGCHSGASIPSNLLWIFTPLSGSFPPVTDGADICGT